MLMGLNVMFGIMPISQFILSRFDKMADKNSNINDAKRLIELMRKVVKEEFTQQEKSISKLVSGNF